jgi:hypothetical protein
VLHYIVLCRTSSRLIRSVLYCNLSLQREGIMDEIPLFHLLNITQERWTDGQQSNGLNGEPKPTDIDTAYAPYPVLSCSLLSYPHHLSGISVLYMHTHAHTHSHIPNSALKLLWRHSEQNRCRQMVTVQVRSNTPRGKG